MPSQRDPAALKWCPWTLSTWCVSVNTGNCVYANKMQHNQLLKLRKKGKKLKREETFKGGLWKHLLHTCGVRSCWQQQQLYCLLGFHTNSSSIFIPLYFSPPTKCLKVGKMKEQEEEQYLGWAALQLLSHGSSSKEEPSLLRRTCRCAQALGVSKNKVQIWGVKSFRKLGRRGIAIIWSYGRSLGANASASKGMRLPISQAWVERGEVSC